MTVIPFDPKKRPGAAAGVPQGVETGLDGRPPPGVEERALREAIRRIDILERTLIATLRENAGNWARAERAEGLLAELAERKA